MTKPKQAGRMKKPPRRRAPKTTRVLADGISAPGAMVAFALPYYTRQEGDTEYLISNPNVSVVSCSLHVFGPKCRVIKSFQFRLKPNCTRSIRIRTVVADHAGFSVLMVSGQVIAHLLYYRAKEAIIVGGELAGIDNLFGWHRLEKTRTYGFGYRATALVQHPIGGAVFVSNPHRDVLAGEIVFYDQTCTPVLRKRVRVKPGCTREYAFPRDCYGYARIGLSAFACINVLHYAGRKPALAAAELVGESNRLTPPKDPPLQRSKVLLDDSHGCRPGNTYALYENALVSAGYAVSHHTLPSVTLTELKKHHVFVVAMAIESYSSSEKQAISDFVNQGGGLLMATDFGGGVWSTPMRELLNTFGASDENNVLSDPTNHISDPGMGAGHAIFDSQRNFLPHPIVDTVTSFHVDASATLSADSAWSTVVETDDDTVPARRPVLIARAFGSGRLVGFGDTNAWSDVYFNDLDNGRLAVRCTEWLLFRI